jgi:hypothetical protein
MVDLPSFFYLGCFPLLMMGMLDEDEYLVLQKLQEIREKKVISLE